MTRKISVSLPDEVADRLEHKANVSAYVADALQMRYTREDIDRTYAAAGVNATDEQRAAARERVRGRLTQARTQCSPELFEQMRKLHGFPTIK